MRRLRLVACAFHTVVWGVLGLGSLLDHEYMVATMALVIVLWGIAFNVLRPDPARGSQGAGQRAAAGNNKTDLDAMQEDT